jgi:hypothetical protein
MERLRAVFEGPYRLADEAGADPAAALDALCAILETHADYLLDSIVEDGWARFVTRAMNHDDSGPISSEVTREFVEEHHDRCIALVRTVIGPKSKADILFRTFMILGQFSTFFVDQEKVLAKFGWQDFRGPRLKMLKKMLVSQTRAALSGP